MVQNKALAISCKTALRFFTHKVLPYLTALLLWGIIWQIASYNIGIELILPSPKATFSRLWELIPTKEFSGAVFSSMRRVLGGFALGAFVGVLVGAVSFFVPFAETFFSPVLKTVRATPVSSFILLVVLWMKTDSVPIFIAFLMVLPIVSQNILTGLKNTSSELTEVSGMYGLGMYKKLRFLYIPSVAPYFGASCSTALGLAWKAGIAAEVLCVCRSSIGENLYMSRLYFESAELLAWTVGVIILSILLEGAGKLVVFVIKAMYKMSKSPRKSVI